MTDYRIEAKVRNARLLRALESIGETPTSFARKNDLYPATVCGLVAMTRKPVLADGSWRKEVMAICEATRKMPCELFTEKQMTAKAKTSTKREVSEAELETALEATRVELLPPPEERMHAQTVARELFEWLHEKYPRLAKVAAMRQKGFTLDEVAEEFGLSRGRIGQMEAKAYRLMKGKARVRFRAKNYLEAIGE